MEELAAQYISPEARCKTSGVEEEGSQVTFSQVGRRARGYTRGMAMRGCVAGGAGRCTPA